jgi:hypothetical protein
MSDLTDVAFRVALLSFFPLEDDHELPTRYLAEETAGSFDHTVAERSGAEATEHLS